MSAPFALTAVSVISSSQNSLGQFIVTLRKKEEGVGSVGSVGSMGSTGDRKNKNIGL